MGRFMLVLLGACTFNHGERSDAGLDVVTACTPGAHVCSGRQRETCDATGSGIDPALTITCPLSCELNECTRARNLPADLQQSCTKATGTALVLPAADATGYAGNAYADVNDTITCYSGTACAFAPIAPTGKVDQPGDRDLVWYCLSELTMSTASSFIILNDDSLFSPIFFVDGDVIIEGTIDNDGDSAGGQAGAGAYRGGALSVGAGTPGLGGCGGGGGDTVTVAGGGGGGGGSRTAGAVGGDGGGPTARGGSAGGASCDSIFLEPLVGGSGGGGGGSTGTCAGCGQGGGGGGGAIQIVATGRIEIRAGAQFLDYGGSGGTDFSAANGGGGGGGAGGAILLEAPQLVVEGQLIVDGGAGGSSATIGGFGGNNASLPTAGTNFIVSPQGGGGGGGATGRIRLESESETSCPVVTTSADPCTAGPLERLR